MKPAPVRLVLVDDQTIILEGLAALLDGDSAFEVVGTAGSGEHAIKVVMRTEPDVVLMDISMPPGISGIEATRHLKKRYPEVRVLMLSMFSKADLVQEALEAGALGYLLKNTSRKELKEALLAVADGRQYLAEEVKTAMAAGNGNGSSDDSGASLTKRERQVLQLLIKQQSNQEIAAALELSVLTVETHRKHIYRKLGSHSAADLMLYAMERGWHL